MPAKFLIALLAYITLLNFDGCEANIDTPFCKKCACVPRPDNLMVSVNCSGKMLDDEYLFASRNWMINANESYAIDKVFLAHCEIGDIDRPFSSSNLSLLDLSDNFVRKMFDGVFANLQNMETLILSDNQLVDIKPDVFKGLRLDGQDYPLRNLRTLKLDENRLHTLRQDLFQHIENDLEVLYLNYNPFKVIDFNSVVAITNIVNLRQLHLAFTKLESLPENFLHTPAHLEILDLSGNYFTTIPVGLEQSQALRVLYFGANPVVNISESNVFPSIKTLEVLRLCNMEQLKEIGDGGLSKLQNLQELHIRDNLVLEKISVGALSRKEIDSESMVWPPLKKLYITGNGVSHLDMELLLAWERLTDLDLNDNEWSCDCENQWMVDELVPIYSTIDRASCKRVRCTGPIEMEGRTFYDIYTTNHSLRCLDAYGNRPEKDASLLIGLLIGLLTGIPIILFGIFAYQRNWFGFFDSGPAAFSRQFYKRTNADEL